jgi:hypothetical protein
LDIDLLPATSEGRSIWSRGVQRLGRVPFSIPIARGGQEGRPVMISDPDSAAGQAFRLIATKMQASVG